MSAFVADELITDKQGGVLRLVLNRPDQLNALSTPLATAIHQAIQDAGTDPEVRVVVVTGAGRAFCAGADLAEVGQKAADPDDFRRFLILLRDALNAIERCPKPVICAVNGITLAGGLELALACDFIVISRGARIGDGHARYGLVPGGGGTQRLPDAVGVRMARRLMYTAEALTADEAMAVGLVQQVFDEAAFADEVAKLAGGLAAKSQPGLAFMKRMSRSRLVTEDGIDLEVEAAVAVVGSSDAREGVAAFLGKREPRFTATI
jgi:enoyl-CoA hydratase/carnithine racemase